MYVIQEPKFLTATLLCPWKLRQGSALGACGIWGLTLSCGFYFLSPKVLTPISQLQNLVSTSDKQHGVSRHRCCSQKPRSVSTDKSWEAQRRAAKPWEGSKPCYLGTVGRSGQLWNGVEKTQGTVLLIKHSLLTVQWSHLKKSLQPEAANSWYIQQHRYIFKI